ncbi:MAG TPA: UDP-N-acetylmuramoyl-L-alanyl-D-glutamate--2,6-diaminopimelate ligase [Actinomycetota bacterium]|nr:UDP-N-acetylmuramoyl-L-alanyl-D-glutamate--2,6-diaminopimelate ligase [Actinomycetota bacterium]
MDPTFPQVRLADVAAVVGAEVRGDPEGTVRDASNDSRDVPAGSLFFCIPGERADGHAFAQQAVDAGAGALVVDHPLAIAAPQLVVRSVREAIGPMSTAVFGYPARELTVIGVTGTNGKTTITYLLESVFRAAGWAPGVIGTTGLRIDGVPSPLSHTTPEAPELQRAFAQMRADGVRAVAVEISSHALAQHRVDGLVVDAAIFTNLSQDHLDLHGTMDAYFEAKRRLFTPALARHGVVNADDAWGRRLLEEPLIPMTSYGAEHEADVGATEVAVDAGGSTATIDGVRVGTALRGRFNVENVLAAVAAAGVVGIPTEIAARGIAQVGPVPGRMEPIDAGQDFTVVVDYAHTPDSIHNVLQGARGSAEGRVIVVFGCGGDRDRAKRPMMGRAAAEDADLVIVTTDNPRSEDPRVIIDQITSGIPDGAAAVVEPDRAAAIKRAIDTAEPGDVVVVAGKGHETTQEIDGSFLPFDDREVARAALARRGSA